MKKRIGDAANRFVKQYGEDEYYTKGIQSKLESWIYNTNKLEIQEIFLLLFDNFMYFNKQEIKSNILNMWKLMINELNQDIDNLCIVPIEATDNSHTSSDEMIGVIKELFRSREIDMYTDTILTSINVMPKDINQVALFDDISGTGMTIDKFIQRNISKLEGCNVHINLIVSTEEAKKKLESIVIPAGKVYVRSSIIVGPVFNELEVLGEDYRNKMYKFEEGLWGEKSKNILGYNELLIGFSHNTPNNTISSFWITEDIIKNKCRWSPLFDRMTKNRRPKTSEVNRLIQKQKED